MSQDRSSSGDSDGSDVASIASTISFDRPGTWSVDIGPALMLPTVFAEAAIGDDLHVEFLKVGDEKNHVVFRVQLKEALKVDGVTYQGARISMEMADEVFLVLDNSEAGAFYDAEKIAGHDFYPGQFTVKLLTYDTPTFSQYHTASFEIIKAGLTLGDLVDIGKNSNIYKFVFLSYESAKTPKELWKGCRDFILQYWILLVNEGIVRKTSNAGGSLTTHITFTYKNEGTFYRQIDKGDFVRFDRNVEDNDVRVAYLCLWAAAIARHIRVL